MTVHTVLVTGVGGNIGQGIIKALRSGHRTYRIVGIDMEPLSAGFSFVDRSYRTAPTGSKMFEKELKQILAAESPEAVYVCSPSELSFFSTHKVELERDFGVTVFVNPKRVVEIGSDKFLTAVFLHNANLPQVETVIAEDDEAVNWLVEMVGFPLIAKPRKGFSSHNVFQVRSQAEIEAARALVPDLVLQRYIAASDCEFTAGTVSDKAGKVKGCIILHRHLLQGTTYRTELFEDEEVTREVIKIVEALGAVGVCNVQFKLEGRKVLVFEINPRFSGTSGVRYLYGFNDAEMVFELLHLGTDVQQPVLQRGVVLRYWNEVFIPGVDFENIRIHQEVRSDWQTVVMEPRSVVEKAVS